MSYNYIFTGKRELISCTKRENSIKYSLFKEDDLFSIEKSVRLSEQYIKDGRIVVNKLDIVAENIISEEVATKLIKNLQNSNEI